MIVKRGICSVTVSNNGSSDGQRINIYFASGVALVTQMREGLQAVTSSRKICNKLRPLLKKLMLLKFSNKCLNVDHKSERKVIEKIGFCCLSQFSGLSSLLTVTAAILR